MWKYVKEIAHSWGLSFLQDMCVVCGSFGLGAEGRLLACAQCGQCYHPFCVGIKVCSFYIMLHIQHLLLCSAGGTHAGSGGIISFNTLENIGYIFTNNLHSAWDESMFYLLFPPFSNDSRRLKKWVWERLISFVFRDLDATCLKISVLRSPRWCWAKAGGVWSAQCVRPVARPPTLAACYCVMTVTSATTHTASTPHCRTCPKTAGSANGKWWSGIFGLIVLSEVTREEWPHFSLSPAGVCPVRSVAPPRRVWGVTGRIITLSVLLAQVFQHAPSASSATAKAPSLSSVDNVTGMQPVSLR